MRKKEIKEFLLKLLGVEDIKCQHCNKTTDSLYIFNEKLSQNELLELSSDFLLAELKRSVLLCLDCKSSFLRKKTVTNWRHGTLSMVNIGCPCLLCRRLKKSINDRYKYRKKAKMYTLKDIMKKPESGT
jgi:hypothetical protein